MKKILLYLVVGISTLVLGVTYQLNSKYDSTTPDGSTYQFNHALMQETIYETLSYAQRQQWHTQFGNWLVDHQPDEPLEVVAYHAACR